MDFTNNDLRICVEALPIALSQDYSSTDATNYNLKTKNRFAKPILRVYEVPPERIVEFLQNAGAADRFTFTGTVNTNLDATITWRATLNLRTRNLEIKELKGRACTKGQTHQDGVAWLQKYCAVGRFVVEGAK